jgi:hypothetical protein
VLEALAIDLEDLVALLQADLLRLEQEEQGL